MRKNIVFCADKNYLPFVTACIESIIKTQYNICDYVFHIISDLAEDSFFLGKLREIRNNVFVVWHHIDDDLFLDYIEIAHFTRAMYYRLLIPELLADEKSALYLDCDILVRGDISELFKVDFANTYLAAVRNPLFTRHDILGIQPNFGYFNSGVMVVNIPKWNDDRLKESILNILKDKESVITMPDQDALNIAVKGSWKSLSDTYNMQVSTLCDYESFDDNSDTFYNALTSPKIVHFSATNKQWHRSCFIKYREEYLELKNAITVNKRNIIFDFLISKCYRAYYKIYRNNPFI